MLENYLERLESAWNEILSIFKHFQAFSREIKGNKGLQDVQD